MKHAIKTERGMSPELEQRLYDEFSLLYRMRHLDSPKMCGGWSGIQCGDGWFDLLRKLSAEIAHYAKQQHLDPIVTEVYVRSGTLIVKVDCDDEHIHALCKKAQEVSCHTCETCGEAGDFVSDPPYGIRISCTKHVVERDDRPLTDDEIARLRIVNERLYSIGIEILEETRRNIALLNQRVADPFDPLDDFEIEIVVDFVLDENDPDYREDDDNILTSRNYWISRQGANGETELLEDRNWHEGVAPGMLESPCYIFHDLYCHSLGSGRQRLSMRDVLRIGDAWINIEIQAQMFRKLIERNE
jgi:hypothetical protein